MIRSALINVMTAAARKAGRSLKRDFGEVENLQVSLKGPANFVSNADKRAEEILRVELERARPGYGFIGEEGGKREGSDKTHTWIVDPLDGTTNFLHGIPQFAVSIGLQRDDTIVAGLIYNPATDDIFTAERGKGAFLNDRRVRVAARKRMAEAVVACGLPHLGRGGLAEFRKEFGLVQELISAIRTIRAEYGVQPGQLVRAAVSGASAAAAAGLKQERPTITRLAKLSELSLAESRERVGGHAVLSDGTAVFVPLGDAIDLGRECGRLGTEVDRLRKLVESQEKKLGNEQFVARAPAAVVEKEREKLTSWREQAGTLAEKRTRLGC